MHGSGLQDVMMIARDAGFGGTQEVLEVDRFTRQMPYLQFEMCKGAPLR